MDQSESALNDGPSNSKHAGASPRRIKGEMMADVTFFARVKAFECEGVRKNLILVNTISPTVHVWDDVAQHYTVCHSLSERTQRRLRREAATIREEMRNSGRLPR